MIKEFVTERLKLIDLYPDKAKSIAKEYGLKENEVELIRKGRISSQPVIDRDARTVINYISTDAIDRDNEVIEHKGVVLDDYMKNPIVPWAHDYHGLPIGKNLWIKSDRKGLVAKTYFLKHAFAEDVFDLYTEDIKGTGPALKAWSVGFVPLKWKDAKPGDKDALPDERSQVVRRTYKKWLLLEYSAVPVPSNPEALTLMVEKGLIKDGKLKKDIEDFITETKEKVEQNKLTKEVCPKCGGDLETGMADEYFICTKCDWDNSNIGDETVLVCKEVVLKPEETDDFIRIPVRDCKVTATITISEKEGITALYCGEVKKIRTYIFSKKEPYSWTMKKALAWVKEHGKELLYVPKVIPGQSMEDIERWMQWIIDNDTESFDLGDGSFIAKGHIEETEEKSEKSKIEDPIEWMKAFASEMRELKEGQVLSAKHRKWVKECIEYQSKAAEILVKLMEAAEPPKEESVFPLIEKSKPKEKNNLMMKDVPVDIYTEEVLKAINRVASSQQDIQKLFDKRHGKV